MPLPIEPNVPTKPLPLRADAILDIQKRAAFWARLSVFASVVVAAGALALAWQGVLHWAWLGALALLPLIPIAAQTRIEELGRKVLDQVRDVQNEEVRRQAVEGGRGH